MATEYKLSYTADEIDRRLGVINENKEVCADLTTRMSSNEDSIASLETDVENLQTTIDNIDSMELITTDDIDAICSSDV